MWLNNKHAGILLILWFIAECTSWLGLIFQSYEANALEDVMWCIWFIIAFIYSKKEARYILIPIILYYITCHLPSLIIRLKNIPSLPIKPNDLSPFLPPEYSTIINLAGSLAPLATL